MKPPESLGKAGRARWEALADGVEFRPDELILLEEACLTADTLARLRAQPPDPKVDVEIRLQSDHLKKLLRSIGWPDEGDASSAGRNLVLARKDRRGA